MRRDVTGLNEWEEQTQQTTPTTPNLDQCRLAVDYPTRFEIGSSQVEQHLGIVKIVKLYKAVLILLKNLKSQKKSKFFLHKNMSLHKTKRPQTSDKCAVMVRASSNLLTVIVSGRHSYKSVHRLFTRRHNKTIYRLHNTH